MVRCPADQVDDLERLGDAAVCVGLGEKGAMRGGRLDAGERRARLAALADAFMAQASADGRVREQFELVFMTGWSPGPDQPQPAKRGSATASLAASLKSKA